MAKIIGNTTATPNPRPDWLQNDENKADYIKNKPEVVVRTDIDNELNLESGNPVQNSTITQRFNELDESLKEYIDEQNSEQDENLGKLETLVTETMKATEINENSTDEQYPTAKAVHDMNQSTIEYINNQNNTQDEEFTKLVTETVKITTIDNSSTNDKYPTAKATYDFVKAETASMVDSAPETLDTLNELAAALGDDPNFATTVATQIGKKADKETFDEHINNKENPHKVTLTQLGVDATDTELNYIKGVKSDVQTQLDDKSPKNHTHNYNDLTNTPTSLPANGGNADTLDGKHASDFEVAGAANSALVDAKAYADLIKSEIENGESDNFSFDEEIVNSENFSIKVVPESSGKYAAINKVGGMSYKSRNLLEITATTKTVNGVTFTVQNNGSIHASGTATALAILDLGEISKKLTVGKTYKMSGIHACRIAKSDGTYSYPADSFTYTSDMTAIYPYLQVMSGVEITQNYFPMVIESTETNTLFEKYYSGIRNVATTKVITTGKNLLKAPETATVKGPSNILNNVPCYLKANHTYIFFFNNPNKIGTQVFFHNRYGNSNLTFYPSIVEKPYNVFTPTEDIYSMRMFYNGAGTITQPMVVEGSEVVTYEVYKENVLEIPTEVIATTGYGLGINENCYNYIDWERKVFVKRCIKVSGFTKAHSHSTVGAWSTPRPTEVNLTAEFGLCSLNVPYQGSDADTPHWYIGNGSIWIYAPTGENMGNAEIIVPLTVPEEIDISAYLPDDNFLEVAAGGVITAVNEYNYDAPTEISFFASESPEKVIVANKIVGDLVGVAEEAQTLSGLESSITDLNYLQGAKGNIQDQIDNLDVKAPSIVVDEALNTTSTNPVQNKVVNAAINAKANASDLTSHTGNKNNPHGVSLSQLGVTATAAELNTLDGITATTTELNYVDGVTSNIQTQLNNKASAGFHKTWSCVTTVGSYSKLCRISGYSNFIMRIGISQSDQVSYFTLLIGTGHNNATISCLGGSGYVNNTNQIVRLTKQSATVFDVELYNTYGYNSATSVSVGCNILSPHSDINVTTYTAYTATSGTAVASCTCKPSGIVSPTFYGALSGNADTATKLKTERNIALGADFTGSANFDGSGNITINGYHYRATINGGNKANYPWHRIAYRGTKTAPITGNYSDSDAIFLIRQTYSGGGYGILKVSLRTNDSNAVAVASATWLMRSGFAADVVKIGLRNTISAAYADLYIKVGTYPRTVISQLEGGRIWSLVSSTEANDTTTSDKKTSVECYATIETAATTLHGQAYSSIISAVDGGIINYANSAGGVAWSGISSKPSYYDAKAIKGITRSGTTFTYTCMDGTTGTFTQQDNNTTYSAATTSANGLMTAAMVTKLNGIATGANAYTHPTTPGNKHIPSGGSAGQILRWSADGTAAWGADNNTTYTLGSFGITATATELNYCDGVTSNIQTQLNSISSSADTADMNASEALSLVQDLTVPYTGSLNSLKTPGLHYVANSDGAGYPVGTNGYVLVIASADQTRVRQVFFRSGTLDSNDHHWYSRQFSSSWGQWTLLSGTASRYSGTYTNGDTAINIGSIHGAASGWVVVAQIGANKRMASIFIPRAFLTTDTTKWCFSMSGDDYYLTFYFYNSGETLYLRINTSSNFSTNAIRYVYAMS